MKTIQDTFTASEVAWLTGLNPETLRVWRRRNYFKLEGEKEGWTRFTFFDVLKIATFAATVNGQGSHLLAELIAANCGEQFAKLFRESSENDPAPRMICYKPYEGEIELLVVHGHNNLLAAMLRALKEAPTFFVVDYLAILESVMFRLHAMNNEAAD